MNKIKIILLMIVAGLLLFVISIFSLIVVVALSIYDLFAGKKTLSALDSFMSW